MPVLHKCRPAYLAVCDLNELTNLSIACPCLRTSHLLLQVAMDLVTASAETNGALAGAMFWNAAHNDTVDWDGYNVRIDRPAYVVI